MQMTQNMKEQLRGIDVRTRQPFPKRLRKNGRFIDALGLTASARVAVTGDSLYLRTVEEFSGSVRYFRKRKEVTGLPVSNEKTFDRAVVFLSTEEVAEADDELICCLSLLVRPGGTISVVVLDSDDDGSITALEKLTERLFVNQDAWTFQTDIGVARVVLV